MCGAVTHPHVPVVYNHVVNLSVVVGKKSNEFHDENGGCGNKGAYQVK